MSEIDWEALERINEEQANDNAFHDLDCTLVPGEGDNPIAFIIGEAPGAQEVIKRRPFVGPAGRVQRSLTAIAGLHAEYGAHPIGHPLAGNPNCWLTNVVKFRPSRNRKPYHAEIVAARPYLRREWLAVGSPRVIVTVGGTALSAVLGRQCSILRVVGEPQMHIGRDGQEMVLWPMLHPAFGLRVPDVRKLIEHDWARLAAWMRDAGYSG